MKPVAFATTNAEKLLIAQVICAEANVALQQVFLDIDEIQGEDPEVIVRDKAQRAYDQYQQPIVVSDDSWSIPALSGFPGAYMKSINYWFSGDDWLRLMKGVADRTVILHQYLAYTDGQQTVVFSNDISGKILNQTQGKNDKSPNMTVIALDSDDGKSLAEVFAAGGFAVKKRYLERNDAWHELVSWYIKQFK